MASGSTTEVVASPAGRLRGPATVVALAATAAVLYILPANDTWAGVALAAGSVVLAATGRRPVVVHAAVAWLAVEVAALVVGRDPWPVPAVVGLAACAVVVVARPALRRSLRADWLRAGRFTPAIWLLLAAAVAGSAVALVVWAHLTRPDTSGVRTAFGALPLPALVLAGVAFAAVNAAAEEILFRGLVMSAVADLVRRRWLIVATQAVAFGVAHVQGFPGGVVGIVLAALYGGVLGEIRMRAGGLLPSWVAHVVADSVIFGLMVGAF